MALPTAASKWRRLTTTLLPPSALCSLRRYWWGHDTLEDKELRRALAQEKRLVKWTTPGENLDEKAQFCYSPARIYDEAATLAQPDKPFLNYNKPEIANELRKPRLPVTDYNYYVQERMKAKYVALVRSQIFIRERVVALGPDLAAAHFLLYRNCRVRFKGQDEWTELDRYQKAPIPETFQPGWFIEAIDAAESNLVYEGLQNMRNLVFLKYLDLSYSPYIDAWTLDRITGEYRDSLEFLDLSGKVFVYTA